MGMISLILIAVITLLGIGVAVYASQHQRSQETVVASTEPAEEVQEVQEEVTPEEEEDYLKYLDEEEEKEEKEPTVLPYYIKVNYQAQTVTVYGLDENGEYTKPVTAFVCSTGTDTPKSGVYPLKAKYRWVNLKGNVYGQYSSRIVGSILFHSVYYYEKFNPSTLCYTGYDRLGSKASAGCVRLTVGDAKWIYDNCPVGTKVEFYASSNPGPLGKPASKRISSNEVCRGWDPTDPDPKNPWRTYVEPEVQPEAPVVTPQPVPESPSVPEQDIKPTPVKVAGVTLNTTNLSMKVGDAPQTLTATVTPVDAANKTVRWKSSDEAVVTVNDGVVTAVGKGTATITVTTEDGSKTATCIVTVTEKTTGTQTEGTTKPGETTTNT